MVSAHAISDYKEAKVGTFFGAAARMEERQYGVLIVIANHADISGLTKHEVFVSGRNDRFKGERSCGAAIHHERFCFYLILRDGWQLYRNLRSSGYGCILAFTVLAGLTFA
jgi:hypothetical protein